MNFKNFKLAVAKNFKEMQKTGLYFVEVDKDKLWETYLGSFPDGTNPIFRKRTEHDCSCCRQFIKTVGHVVTIVNGKMVSIWDKINTETDYDTVAEALSEFIHKHEIENMFFHYESKAGTDKSFEQLVDGSSHTWEHFFVNIPGEFVFKKDQQGAYLSGKRADYEVLLRSLKEITMDSVDMVLELIKQDSLYRGAEHTNTLTRFKELKVEFDHAENGELFVWNYIRNGIGSIMRIRNTSIGTLLVDLSNGKDLEESVAAFERMVAPMNYKRPKALVTKRMVEEAKAKLQELGLVSALERRYANINDITINNVIWANRDAKAKMDVFDDISDSIAVDIKKLNKVEEIGVEKFISDVLPAVKTVEMMVDNSHVGNFVSLVAPVDPTAGCLFKWNNNFSWDYNGHLTDSIKERVKQAGGNVTGDLCCRLSWFNTDDLDLHMLEPDGGHIYFNARHSYTTSGTLDVDMNVQGERTDPVENIFYKNRRDMKEGVYYLVVHQFKQRNYDNKTQGFVVEFDYLGEVRTFAYNSIVRQDDRIDVVVFKYTHKDGIKILRSLSESTLSRSVWGVNTKTFVPVRVIMNSPNYWDGHGVGNKHWFFMLDGCKNDDVARGFYNEYLKEEFNKHRKVFEIVGSKMMTEGTDQQLSGLGFSSTMRNSVLVKVTGKFSRILKVNF